ncbi:MAG: glycoside hydrolase family protein [Spartobacteria bacterium]|nr:glycoside hydrolase family protein [Spartobacteria bacterium]
MRMLNLNAGYPRRRSSSGIAWPKLPVFGVFLVLQAHLCWATSNSVVNLSHYDTIRSDFARMRNEGIISVIHEATYPRFNRDAKYSARQQAATEAGLLWGAYHFGDATNPVVQADHFLEVVRSAWLAADPSSRPREVLLVLDFEQNGHYPGGTMRVDQAVTFVERIRERTGKYPGVYSNENRIRKTLGNATVNYQRVLAKCWLWAANYHCQPRTTSPWNDWDLWQYTGDGVCGLPRARFPTHVANMRRAERNMFRGNETALKTFWSERACQPDGTSSQEKLLPRSGMDPDRRCEFSDLVTTTNAVCADRGVSKHSPRVRSESIDTLDLP